ncbi:MAG: hypothetical protein QXT64_02985 [Desulfurococcaceae archaeon]
MSDKPGAQSPGRIFLVAVVVVLFFSLFSTVFTFMVESVSSLSTSVEEGVGKPSVMQALYGTLTALIKWIKTVLVDRFGFAIVLLVSLVYEILAGD